MSPLPSPLRIPILQPADTDSINKIHPHVAPIAEDAFSGVSSSISSSSNSSSNNNNKIKGPVTNKDGATEKPTTLGETKTGKPKRCRNNGAKKAKSETLVVARETSKDKRASSTKERTLAPPGNKGRDEHFYHEANSDSDYEPSDEYEPSDYEPSDEYDPSDDCYAGFGLAMVISPKTPQPTKPRNLEGSKLTAAAKRCLKNLAPFNSPAVVNKGVCDFDTVLEISQQQKSARTCRKPQAANQNDTTSSSSTTTITHDSLEYKAAVRRNIVRGRKRPLPTPILAWPRTTKQQQQQPQSPSSDSPTSPFQGSSERSTSGNEYSFETTVVTKKKKPSTRKQKLPSKCSLVAEKKHDDEDKNEKPFPTRTNPEFYSARKKSKNAGDRLDRKRRKRAKQKKYILDQPASIKSSNDASNNSNNSLSNDSSSGNEAPKPDGPIPRFLPASVQRALKRLAPHNDAGRTTAGDNAFILDTALYSARETRRRRRTA
jgi:hypothetical protein